MNRVSELFSGGQRVAKAAVLYHGESEWAGYAMPFELPLRRLYDRQICCDVLPCDVFAQPELYGTVTGKRLKVNAREYQAVVVPQADFITREAARALAELSQEGFPVFYVDSVPLGLCDGAAPVPDAMRCGKVAALDSLADVLEGLGLMEAALTPACNRIRVLHYAGECHMYMLVNEGTETYRGTVKLPVQGPCYYYNAFENQPEAARFRQDHDGVVLQLILEPLKSRILLFDLPETPLSQPCLPAQTERTELKKWKRSLCRSIDYPRFTEETDVSLPDGLASKRPDFSGFVRYETTFKAEKGHYFLEITDTCEGVELFVNGSSLGLKIAPPMRYDLDKTLRPGENTLVVEAATTLERGNFNPAEDGRLPKCGSGLTGTVHIYRG